MPISKRSARVTFRGPLGIGASLLAGALLAASLCAVASPASAAERGPLARGAPVVGAETEARVIVKFKPESGLMRALSASSGQMLPQHAGALGSRLGITLTDGRVIGPRAQVMKGKGMSSRDLADRLSAESDVEYAVVDGRMHALAVPNDPLYPPQSVGSGVTPVVGQWYLRAPDSATIFDATTVVASINAEAAWNVTTGNASVVVAVLDTGIRADHPDLASKVLAGYDFISDVATANDGDGRDSSPADPGDFGTCSGTTDNSSWHGTQTSGLIGASTNNGTGMASVGYNVMLLPVRVLGKCGGFDSDIQAALLWAGGISSSPIVNQHPAKVINMSLGAAGACSSSYADVFAQLAAKNVVVVAAAGNDGLAVGTPANCPNVIGVAGVRHAGTKVGYSDLGPQIAIAAPAGNCVNTSGTCLFPLLTTSNTGTTTPVAGAPGAKYTGGGADASLGTSFSAPLVSGTVALMFSANPGLTPSQVLTALKATARGFPSAGAGTGVAACTVPTTSSTAQSSECYCTASTCGAGLLDAGAAVARVAIAVANISVASSAATVGTSVTLDGSTSRGAAAGSTIASYAWSITSGGSIASITSSANASTVAVLPTAPGTVVVSLTVTDSANNTATTTSTLTVTAVGSTTTPVPASGGGSSGGGAMSLGWLAAWLAMIAAIWAVTPRRRSIRA